MRHDRKSNQMSFLDLAESEQDALFRTMQSSWWRSSDNLFWGQFLFAIFRMSKRLLSEGFCQRLFSELEPIKRHFCARRKENSTSVHLQVSWSTHFASGCCLNYIALANTVVSVAWGLAFKVSVCSVAFLLIGIYNASVLCLSFDWVRLTISLQLCSYVFCYESCGSCATSSCFKRVRVTLRTKKVALAGCRFE